MVPGRTNTVLRKYRLNTRYVFCHLLSGCEQLVNFRLTGKGLFNPPDYTYQGVMYDYANDPGSANGPAVIIEWRGTWIIVSMIHQSYRLWSSAVRGCWWALSCVAVEAGNPGFPISTAPMAYEDRWLLWNWVALLMTGFSSGPFFIIFVSDGILSSFQSLWRLSSVVCKGFYDSGSMLHAFMSRLETSLSCSWARPLLARRRVDLQAWSCAHRPSCERGPASVDGVGVGVWTWTGYQLSREQWCFSPGPAM